MNLIKTSFWTGLSTIIKVLSGIVTTKIMATYVGPSGVALLGNFTNITGIMTSFANGAIGTGVTKYIAEFELEDKKIDVINHSVKISFVCSSLISLVVLIFHKSLAKFSFGDTNYSLAFILFGCFILLYGLNSLFISILNGYRFVKYIVFSGIVGSIISVLLAFFITLKFGLLGALVNSTIAQIFIFVINIILVSRLQIFRRLCISKRFNKELLWNLFKFAMMSITSTLVVPASTLFIRKYIISNYAASEAGYVQGIWNISTAYLMIITSTLSIYYLPTLSSLNNIFDLRNEILNGYKIILPSAIIGGILVYLLRDIIINLLYAPSFVPMRSYFLFQIIGDTLKIASWILAYLMIAKAMTRIFIITEILFSANYVILSFFLMKYYGSIGVTYAYSINYFLYLLIMLFIFRKILLLKKENNKKVILC